MSDINWAEVERIRNNPARTYDEDALIRVIDQLKVQIDALKVELVEARWHGEQPAP